MHSAVYSMLSSYVKSLTRNLKNNLDMKIKKDRNIKNLIKDPDLFQAVEKLQVAFAKVLGENTGDFVTASIMRALLPLKWSRFRVIYLDVLDHFHNSALSLYMVRSYCDGSVDYQSRNESQFFKVFMALHNDISRLNDFVQWDSESSGLDKLLSMATKTGIPGFHDALMKHLVESIWTCSPDVGIGMLLNDTLSWACAGFLQPIQQLHMTPEQVNQLDTSVIDHISVKDTKSVTKPWDAVLLSVDDVSHTNLFTVYKLSGRDNVDVPEEFIVHSDIEMRNLALFTTYAYRGLTSKQGIKASKLYKKYQKIIKTNKTKEESIQNSSMLFFLGPF